MLSFKGSVFFFFFFFYLMNLGNVNGVFSIMGPDFNSLGSWVWYVVYIKKKGYGYKKRVLWKMLILVF